MKESIILSIFILNFILIFFIVFKQNVIRKKIFNNNHIFLKQKLVRFKRRIMFLILINVLFFLSFKDIYIGYKKSKVNIQNKYGVILLDNSTSMLANDVNTSRFEIGKIYSQVLIDNLKNINYALILFSSFPILQVPFTGDLNYLKFIIQNLYIPENNYKSSKLLNSLQQAIILLRRLPDAEKFIFVFSDMEFFDEINEQTIKKLNLMNIKLYFFIIGTEEGSKIPLQNGYLKDNKGKDVISYATVDKIEIFKNFTYTNIFRILGLQNTYMEQIKKDILKSEKETFYIYTKNNVYNMFLLIIYLIFIFYFIDYSKYFEIDITREFCHYVYKKDKR